MLRIFQFFLFLVHFLIWMLPMSSKIIPIYLVTKHKVVIFSPLLFIAVFWQISSNFLINNFYAKKWFQKFLGIFNGISLRKWLNFYLNYLKHVNYFRKKLYQRCPQMSDLKIMKICQFFTVLFKSTFEKNSEFPKLFLMP